MNIARRRFALAFVLAGLTAGLSQAQQAQEITVWSGYPELEPFYKHVAQGLAKKYPNLRVNVQAIPLREHEKRMALALPSKSAGDVLEMPPSTAARYLEGKLIPAAPADVARFVQDPKTFDKFFAAGASYDGKVYGVPLFRGQSALFYNTEMFAKAGLAGPPKTMAEYSQYAQKLTQRDAAGRPTVSGWTLRLSGGGEGIAEKFWVNLHQYGGALVKQTSDGKYVADYANAAGRQALAQYIDMVHGAKTVTPQMKADAEAFELEQTGMLIRESWVIGDIEKKAKGLKYATAPLPRGAIALPVNLYVTSQGEKAKLAWEFVKATNEPANLVWLLDNVGWLPNRKDVDYSAVIAKTPGLKGFLQYPDDYTFFTLPAIGPISEVLTRLAERLTRAFGDASLANNNAAIDRFLAEAAAETDNILKREGLLGAR